MNFLGLTVQDVKPAIDIVHSPKRLLACIHAEGKQTPRRIIQIRNEFLATVYFVKFYVKMIHSIHLHFCMYTLNMYNIDIQV